MNIYKELYHKRSELQKELSPIAYRLECNPEDKELKRQVKQLRKKIEALSVVMQLYR